MKSARETEFASYTKKDCVSSLLCGANGNRTSDTRIFSPLLYQLSYGTITIQRTCFYKHYAIHGFLPSSLLFFRIAGAKVLLFFDMTKF